MVAGTQCGHGPPTWPLGPSSPSSIGQTVKYCMGLFVIRGSQHRGFRSKVMPSSANLCFKWKISSGSATGLWDRLGA